jgi:UDP-N-acetylmuramoyl-tripeptide--D-alanyl-D-alanine ligase
VPELDLARLAQAGGGRLLRGDPGTVVRSFGIDTRKLEPGGVFFALPGAQRDGHEFLDAARAAGAAAAVVSRDPREGEPAPPALIRVDDVALALRRCGEDVRRRHRGAKWIALTGSNGKTTTKELAAAGLAAAKRVHRTPGNFNNHLGVPLTLLAMPEDAQVAVLELATSGPGEIADLARLADPDVALVTNIRAVHMASFSTLDDVAAAKGELFAVLRDDAVAVVNLDDLHVRVQATRHTGPRVTFGQAPAADLRMEEIDNRLFGAAFTFRYRDRSQRVQLRIGGAHAAHDALAALAAVAAAGEDVGAAASHMERVEAGPGRGRVHRLERGMVLMDDSYNSSPPALASVLETLRLTEPAGRRVLVMGDMLELGPMQGALHREAGRRAAAAGVHVLMAVGPLTRETADAARRAGVGQVHHYADSAECAKSIAEYLRDGDLIVVKGSRGMHLGKVVRALTAQTAGAGN